MGYIELRKDINNWLESEELREWSTTELKKQTFAHSSWTFSDVESDINRDQSKIDELKGDISKIYSRIERLEVAIIKRRVVVAPIRRIPPEILGCIMVHVGSPSFPHRLGDNTNLMLVSKHWRDVALHTHQLWTHYELARRFRAPAIAKALKVWLSRSGTCGISVSIGSGICSVKVAEAFALRASQWTSLRVFGRRRHPGSRSSKPMELFHNALGNASRLVTLELDEQGSNGITSSSLRALQTCHSSLRELITREGLQLPLLEAPGLRTLSLSGRENVTDIIKVDHAIQEIAKRFPRLKELVLPEFFTGSFLFMPEGQTDVANSDAKIQVTNSNLEKLKISTFCALSPVGDFCSLNLKCVRAFPAVRELSIPLSTAMHMAHLALEAGTNLNTIRTLQLVVSDFCDITNNSDWGPMPGMNVWEGGPQFGPQPEATWRSKDSVARFIKAFRGLTCLQMTLRLGEKHVTLKDIFQYLIDESSRVTSEDMSFPVLERVEFHYLKAPPSIHRLEVEFDPLSKAVDLCSNRYLMEDGSHPMLRICVFCEETSLDGGTWEHISNNNWLESTYSRVVKECRHCFADTEAGYSESPPYIVPILAFEPTPFPLQVDELEDD